MKIAMIVPGGVDRGGEERVIPCLLWIIERIARRHELHVFALRQEPRPARYELLGAAVHDGGARPRRLRLAAQLVAEHRRGPFSLIHAVWAAPPGALAAVLGKLLGIPVLLRLTGGDLAAIPRIRYGQRNTWRGRAWLRLAVRGAAHVTTPSHSVQQAAQELGIAAERLPWGVSTDLWAPVAPRPRESGRPARLLFVGTLNPVKDPATLLHAAALLRSRRIAFQLDIVGEDTLGGAMQRLAREVGLEGITLFHGFQPQRRVRELMLAADVLLISSLHEADPIVLLEAAASGVPAVGTTVGHLRDWDPAAAAAVPPADPRALAAAIAELLADEERRLRIALEAQQRALAEDADWSAARVLAIYEQLAGLP